MFGLGSSVLTLVLLIGTGDDSTAPAPQELCCGMDYMSVTCPCSKTKKECSCPTCSADSECTCVEKLRKGKSVIRGKVALRKSHKKRVTVVYVEEMPGIEFKPPAKSYVMDQKGKKFVPRVLPLLVGSTVDFHNNDDFEHNVFSPDGEKYNLGNWGKGEKRSHLFEKPGIYVQLCSIHPEMMGSILVLKTPYFAVVKKDGTFEIPNIPPGSWKLKVWNERFKPKALKKSYPVDAVADETANVEIKIK